MTQFATQIEMQESAIFEHKSAGFWVRFFAFLIDVFLDLLHLDDKIFKSDIR